MTKRRKTMTQEQVKKGVVLKKEEKISAKDLEVASKEIYVPIHKAEGDKRILTGVVIALGETDAHGDITKEEEVVKKAAYNFLINYRRGTTLGVQHSDFTRDIDLLESYVAPQSFMLNGKIVKKGSWIITVKVNDDNIWELVKAGKITGFSFGASAKIRKL